MTKTFSPSEAALSVFELTKRQPQFVMRYGLLSAAVMGLSMIVMSSTGAGEAVQRYMALIQTQTQTPPSMEQIQAILGPAAPAFFFFVVVNSILNALLIGMGLRKTIHDREAGFWGLQVGADEGRFLVGTLAFSGLLTAVAMGLSMISSILAGLNAALGWLAVMVSIGVFCLVALRLSQYGVMGIVTGRLGIKDSLAQTKDHLWRYLGAYVLWAVITMIVSGIVQALATLGALALGTRIGTGIPSTPQDMLSAGWAFYILLYGAVAGICNLGFLCVGAYAWHQSQGSLPTPKSII